MEKPWEMRWTIGDRIGGGGQGNTYFATEKESGADRRFALKLLKRNDDKGARDRMRREVANLRSLLANGADVPRVYDDNTDEAEGAVDLFLVMDFITGDTLEKVVPEGGLSIDVAAGLTLKLCETVRIAHTLPLVHRDLKPENIIVRDIKRNDVVIIDYGLSFNAEDDDVTQSGEGMRNKFFALPEMNVPGGNQRDPRSDLSSICAIFYFLLTGIRPVYLRDENDLPPHMRMNGSIRSAHDGDKRVPHLESLLNRGFAVKLGDRFQNVDELTGRLQNACAHDEGARVDPFALAEQIQAEIHANDRPTQLRRFRKTVSKRLKKLQAGLQQTYNRSLPGFHYSTKRSQVPEDGFPDGIDVVGGTDTAFQVHLSVDGHRLLRGICIYVGARGNECVYLVQRYGRGDAPSANIETDSTFEEWLWFDPESEADESAVEDKFKSWIVDAMTEIRDGILGPDQLNGGDPVND